jgi:hypothetical protein
MGVSRVGFGVSLKQSFKFPDNFRKMHLDLPPTPSARKRWAFRQHAGGVRFPDRIIAHSIARICKQISLATLVLPDQARPAALPAAAG